MNTQKTTFLVFLFILVLNQVNYAQEKLTVEKPFIEVNGFAELVIVPDEILITITLKERIENREKISMDTLEEQLKAALKAIDIPIENLSLADLNSQFNRVTRSKSEVLGQIDYILKCNSALMVFNVFQEFEKLKIHRARIKHTNHSKIDSLRREVRTKAIINAKEKADYLLDAIGEKTGKCLVVKENMTAGTNNHLLLPENKSTTYFVDGTRVMGESEMKNDKLKMIEFEKIKMTFTIYVKFEIL
jgi:hypothetical protein